jgi:hypothetical protein
MGKISTMTVPVVARSSGEQAALRNRNFQSLLQNQFLQAVLTGFRHFQERYKISLCGNQSFF